MEKKLQQLQEEVNGLQDLQDDLRLERHYLEIAVEELRIEENYTLPMKNIKVLGAPIIPSHLKGTHQERMSVSDERFKFEKYDDLFYDTVADQML